MLQKWHIEDLLKRKGQGKTEINLFQAERTQKLVREDFKEEDFQIVFPSQDFLCYIIRKDKLTRYAVTRCALELKCQGTGFKFIQCLLVLQTYVPSYH